MDMRRMGLAVVATLAMAGTAMAANDSTSVEEVDVPWKAPSYAASSGTANYATNAGQLGGKAEGQLNVNSAASSTTATNAIAAAAAGVAGSAATATSATTSGYSSTAGNGVAGVNGSNLDLSNGTSYPLPSGGGGGTTFNCSARPDGQSGATIGAYGWESFVPSGLTCQCTAQNTYTNCHW